MSTRTYLACDLGAESGRVMRGTLNGSRLTMEEVHRFPNGGIAIGESLRWDLPRILEELRTGIRRAGAQGRIDGISTDSWGVDYVLVNSAEPVLSLPYHYRDARGEHAFARVFLLAPRDLVFRETGIQFMSLNTLYQLQHDASRRPGIVGLADRFLMMADWCNWAFSGVGVAEESLASTSQIYNPTTRTWSQELIRRLDLPGRIFPPVVKSGTVLGPALASLGVGTAAVVAGCSHDTAAAVAAVPAEGEDWAYLSSGTWSLIGVEREQPILTDAALAENFTNEIGVGGSIRFLKNIVGLWIVQECRRAWHASGQELSYDQLTAEAGKAPAFAALIDPADPRFSSPGDMPQKIAAFCHETGQSAPVGVGPTVRCVLESLALTYRRSLEALARLTGRSVKKLHIVGGGSRNALLNRFAANATGCTVIAGPVEATAIGNLLVQALALGHIADRAELRRIVQESFPVETIQPQDKAAWDTAWRRFSAFMR